MHFGQGNTQNQPLLHSFEDGEKFYAKNEKRIRKLRKKSDTNLAEDLLLNK